MPLSGQERQALLQEALPDLPRQGLYHMVESSPTYPATSDCAMMEERFGLPGDCFRTYKMDHETAP